jgi:hypothetical protein
VPKDLQYQYDWNNPNYVQLELGVKPMQGPLSQVVCCDNIRYSLEVPSGGLVKRHKEKIDQIDIFIENLEPLMNADFAGVSEFLCARRVNDSEGFRYLDLKI